MGKLSRVRRKEIYCNIRGDTMKTVTQHEVKDNVLHLLEMVQQGEEVTIEQNHKNIAVIISYDAYKKQQERPLGILKGKATCTLHDDFAMSDEELLTL